MSHETLPAIPKRFKCPLCKEQPFSSYGWLENHILKVHPDFNERHKEWTVRQFLFHQRNKTDKPSKCVVCKQPTPWNEEAGKYKRLCENPGCKKTLAIAAKQNMVKKYGKEHLLDDPDVQRQMAAERGISGIYKFRDGQTTIRYVGSYEKDFLEFYDKEQEYPPTQITECPHIFNYHYEGKDHFYIPDYFMPDFNLIIEIKDGGDNPNGHPKIQTVDKAKEKLKDAAVINSKQFNYIKITNKEYRNFVEILTTLRDSNVNTYSLDSKLIIIGE